MKNLNCRAFLRLTVLSPVALLSIVFLALFVFPLNAQIYVAQSAQGTGNGSSPANAESVAWLNQASSWNNGLGTVTQGTIVYLCGTISNSINVQGSGVAGNPITIYFEPNAAMISTDWPSTLEGGQAGGAITIFQQNYITVDGGSNGLIEATANGTGLQYQTTCCGVSGASSSYLTVKNLAIRDMYVRTSDADESGGFGVGVEDTCPVPPSAATNFIVTNCVINDAYIGIMGAYGPGSMNYYFMGNKITRCNWGANCQDTSVSTATMTNFVLANNIINTFSNWDDPGDNDYHHNGFYGWGLVGQIQGALVYGNTIGPNFGQAPVAGTSGVYFSGNVSNILIYNNVFVCNANDSPADALVMVSGVRSLVANNTFIGGELGNAIGINVGTVYNNLAVNDTFILDNYAVTNGLVADYDYGYNLISGQEYSYSYATNGASNFKTFSQWQALGFDLQGSDSINPLLNSDGTLQSGSPVVSLGTNLSSYFTTDFAGNPRPTTGPWTVGAYQVTSGSTPAPIVLLSATPTIVIVGTNPPSTTLAWSSTNATSVSLSGFGSVPLSGITNASPSTSQTTTNYTITATGTGGTAATNVTVTIGPAPPTDLQASPP